MNVSTPQGGRSTGLLGYTPFLDPLQLNDYWLALLPLLVVIIATVYKAIKIEDLSKLPMQVALLSAQIIVFMVLTGAALWVLSEIF